MLFISHKISFDKQIVFWSNSKNQAQIHRYKLTHFLFSVKENILLLRFEMWWYHTSWIEPVMWCDVRLCGDGALDYGFTVKEWWKMHQAPHGVVRIDSCIDRSTGASRIFLQPNSIKGSILFLMTKHRFKIKYITTHNWITQKLFLTITTLKTLNLNGKFSFIKLAKLKDSQLLIVNINVKNNFKWRV